MVKEATLTCSWWIQKPPTPNHEPYCSLCSLPQFFHHLYPFLPHDPHPVPQPLTSLALQQSSYTCAAHMRLLCDLKSAVTLPVWLCQFSASFHCLSLSVCQCLCVSLCLFALLREKTGENEARGWGKKRSSPFWRVEMMAIIVAWWPITTSFSPFVLVR